MLSQLLLKKYCRNHGENRSPGCLLSTGRGRITLSDSWLEWFWYDLTWVICPDPNGHSSWSDLTRCNSSIDQRCPDPVSVNPIRPEPNFDLTRGVLTPFVTQEVWSEPTRPSESDQTRLRTLLPGKQSTSKSVLKSLKNIYMSRDKTSKML